MNTLVLLKSSIKLIYDIELIEDDNIFNSLHSESDIKHLIDQEIEYLIEQEINILDIHDNEIIIDKNKREIKYKIVPFKIYQCDMNGDILKSEKQQLDENLEIKDKRLTFLYKEMLLKPEIFYTPEITERGVKFSCSLCNKSNQKMMIYANKNNFIWTTLSKTDCKDDKHFKKFQGAANTIFKKWKTDHKKLHGIENINKFSKIGIKQTILSHFPKLIKHKNTNHLYFYCPQEQYYKKLDDDVFETLIYKYFFDDTDTISSSKMRDVKNCILRNEIFENQREFNFDKICLKNGVYDIQTGKIEPHNHDYFIVNKINIAFNPLVDQSKLTDIFNQWKVNINLDTFKNIIGYLSQYNNSAQLLFFFVGYPGSGKSTFAKMLNYVLNDRCKQGQTKPLLDDSRHGLTEVIGKTCFIDIDFEEDTFQKVSIKILNILTDGDKVTINPKNKQSFDYESTCKYVAISNNIPTFRSGEDNGGFRRRLYPILFQHVFKSGKDKLDLFDKFKNDNELQETFLLWILEGITNYMNREDYQDIFNMDKVEDLKKEWILKSENVIRFLDETVKGTGNKTDIISCKDLKEKYHNWSDEEGINPVGFQKLESKLFTFFPGLESLQSKSKNIRHQGKVIKGYRGFKFKDNEDREHDNILMGADFKNEL